jgi:hypothetical protein
MDIIFETLNGKGHYKLGSLETKTTDLARFAESADSIRMLVNQWVIIRTL